MPTVKRNQLANAERVTAKNAERVARLDEYGLCPEDTIRWHDADGENYEYAKPRYVNNDGSIAVYTTSWRAVTPEKAEKRGTGPRGGTTWEPVVPGRLV